VTQEEIRLRAMELVIRQAPPSLSVEEAQGIAQGIVGWVNQTPATGVDLDAYIRGKPEEMVGILDSLRVRFNLSKSESSYVAARMVAAVLECRKAQGGVGRG